jgi:hypothetical protein
MGKETLPLLVSSIASTRLHPHNPQSQHVEKYIRRCDDLHVDVVGSWMEQAGTLPRLAGFDAAAGGLGSSFVIQISQL